MEQIKKKSKKKRIILIVLSVLLVVWVSFISIDYYRFLNNSRPIFTVEFPLLFNSLTRPIPTVYIGLGYWVVNDDQIPSLHREVVIELRNLGQPRPPFRRSFHILFFEVSREYAVPVPWDN